jgi:hypothetical protein
LEQVPGGPRRGRWPAREKLQLIFTLAGKSMESDEGKPDTSEDGPSTYHRLLIPRYPFGIFCVVESNGIFIRAVPDLPSRSRKDPRALFRIRRVFHFDRLLAGRMRLERNFFLSIVRSDAAPRRAGGQGIGGESGGLASELFGVRRYFRLEPVG